MSVLIRAASSSDATEIADVHLLSRRARLPYLPELHSDDDVRSFFTHSVLPNSTVLVALRHGQIIGFAAFCDGSLDHLYIRPGNLRSGVGSALLARVKAMNPQGLRLHVFQRNDEARAFYRHHGFVATVYTGGAGNEETEPELAMWWSGETGPKLHHDEP